MAVLLHFEKLHETQQAVTYRFGYPALNRWLTIDPRTEQGTAIEGPLDRDVTAVLAKIIRMRRTTGTWPAKGTYAA